MYDDPGIQRTAKAVGADGFISKSNFADLVMAATDRFTAGVDASAGSL